MVKSEIRIGSRGPGSCSFLIFPSAQLRSQTSCRCLGRRTRARGTRIMTSESLHNLATGIYATGLKSSRTFKCFSLLYQVQVYFNNIRSIFVKSPKILTLVVMILDTSIVQINLILAVRTYTGFIAIIIAHNSGKVMHIMYHKSNSHNIFYTTLYYCQA